MFVLIKFFDFNIWHIVNILILFLRTVELKVFISKQVIFLEIWLILELFIKLELFIEVMTVCDIHILNLSLRLLHFGCASNARLLALLESGGPHR